MRDIYNMIIRRALSEVKKKFAHGRRVVLVLALSRVRAAGLGAKALYRFTNAVQLAALQRPTASRNTHQTKAIAIGDGGIGLGRCDLFGGQLMLTGLQADIGIQLRQTAQLPNDVPYRHPNETADACFFFIF